MPAYLVGWPVAIVLVGDAKLTLQIQLRPVTHRATCDLSLYYTTTYRRIYLSAGPLVGSRRLPSSSPIPCKFKSVPCPLRDAQGMFAFNVPPISVNRTFRGSSASVASHRADPITQTTDSARARNVPRLMITSR